MTSNDGPKKKHVQRGEDGMQGMAVVGGPGAGEKWGSQEAMVEVKVVFWRTMEKC